MEFFGSLDIPLIAEHVEPMEQSFLGWVLSSLGPIHSLLIPASGLVVFVGAVFVIALSKRPAVIAAYLVFVPLPFMIGLCASLYGFIHSFHLAATSAAPPNPGQIAGGISAILFAAFLGLLVTFPGYLVTSLGLFVRTIRSRTESS
jgi:hypothetical protein